MGHKKIRIPLQKSLGYSFFFKKKANQKDYNKPGTSPYSSLISHHCGSSSYVQEGKKELI